MGLTIASGKRYLSWSYHTLHIIRGWTLLACGIPEEKIKAIGALDFYMGYPIEMSRMDICRIQKAGYLYPNLLFHSDCEGGYTMNGEVDINGELETGNTKELLKELEMLKSKLPNDPERFDILGDLIELVKYAIKENKGVIKFC